MFVPGKPFQLSLMFVGKTRSLPYRGAPESLPKPTQVKHLSGAPLYGNLLALPTNIRLGWKGLSGTNALAYYEKAQLTAVKCFITLAATTFGITTIIIATFTMTTFSLMTSSRIEFFVVVLFLTSNLLSVVMTSAILLNDVAPSASF